MREFGDNLAFKRPEENYKYIFKKCLKKLKNRFSEKVDCKGCKKDEVERRFYTFYFGDVAKAEGIKLECFYQPRNGAGSCKETGEGKVKKGGLSKKDIPKTISAKYIQTISKSKSFLQDFHSHLERALLQDYLKNIDRKIVGMFADWHGRSHGPLTNELIAEICHKIETNNKFKMPWTIKEVKTAIGAVQALFRKNEDGGTEF
jgi:hypothetical protein